MNKMVVFDTLEIGPIQLEKNRLVAPYKLTGRDIDDQIDLIYRYEEDVFDPDSVYSQNIASLAAAQVAMNYGLFCNHIIFHGAFETLDAQFIMKMIENTSREIFVNKLLQPNPFLQMSIDELSGNSSDKFTQATLEFPELNELSIQWHLKGNSRNKHAILSSGGKDSLLTFGLLNELGVEIHPIFVNESGRHWFTALNAYRYFEENIPNTSRVWTNADRVFNWMLRHLPFIRKDYAKLRSDEYPIRLWTVAVFLFGALPILLKRGIGRLLIGDEYDTTVLTKFKGISHYNGLYDQSRYFDNALSRFYLRKGWNLSQFSILRPLSEILIQKILVERYPELHWNQVSCHAAHESDGRIYPCGSCEKCRRIVSMLTALDSNPAQCGYLEEQIAHSLKDIVNLGIHQEAPGVQHLLHLLSSHESITLSTAQQKKAKPHPEIMQLRFDSSHAPVQGMPVDLRKPLFEIYLQHTDGALLREHGKWKSFDPLKDDKILEAYPYEIDAMVNPRSMKKHAGQYQSPYLWGEMTWQDAEQRLQEVDIALLPVGSIEQHGPHLPLDTDAFDAEYLAKRIAEMCSHPKPLVLPLISYGVSYEHDEFKGTVSISNDTLSYLIYDIGLSVAKNGIKKLVIINGHGGNNPTLNYAAQMITRDAKIFVCVDTGETSDVDIYQITETPNDVHAGEIETSTSLATRPHLVKMEKAEKLIPKFSSRYLNFTSKRYVSWYAYTKKISENGVLGDPTRASVEKGEKIWNLMITHLLSLVEDLKSMTLEEIYQRRY